MPRGGKRKGAGRKSGPDGARTVTVAFRLTEPEVAALDALRIDGESRSKAARRLLAELVQKATSAETVTRTERAEHV